MISDVFAVLPLLGGAFLAGIVTGLTGFGTALTAMALWLYVVPPLVAAPLVALCSLSVHFLTIREIWPKAHARTAWPYVLGACLGIPAGIWLLTFLTSDTFRVLVGFVLIGYPVLAVCLPGRFQVQEKGAAAAGIVGVVSGVLGGFSGLSGVPLAIWSHACAWSKERTRGVLQITNMAIFGSALVGYGFAGLLTSDLLLIALLCLPASMTGGWVGFNLYSRVDTEAFRKVVLVLLVASGIGLVASRLL